MAIYETQYRRLLVYHSIVTNQAYWTKGSGGDYMYRGTRPPVLCMGLSDKPGLPRMVWGPDFTLIQDGWNPLTESLRAKPQLFITNSMIWADFRISQGTLAGPWEDWNTGFDNAPLPPYASNVSTSYVNGASSYTISKTWVSDSEATLYYAALYTQPRVEDTLFGVYTEREVVWLHIFDTPIQVFVGDQFTLTFTIIL